MDHRPELLPLDDAIATTLGTARELVRARPREIVERELWQARGRVLAEPVLADRDQPPFDRAMMDGYAVRSEDAAAPATDLAVVGEIPAGGSFAGSLEAGQAVSIMTGAALPDGADAVEMIERTERQGDRVTLLEPVSPVQFVAPRGQDVKRGEVVVEAGRVVDGLTVGVLAAVGANTVSVYSRPRVTVIATGSELVDVDERPGPSAIRDSNRFTLMALLDGGQCRTVDGGRVADVLADLTYAIREGLQSDALVLSGGVSVGSYDLVAQALADEGVETVFHGVRSKPGKPVLLGRHPNGCMVLGLPGNPVSVFVGGIVFLLPALRILARRSEPGPYTLEARLSAPLGPGGPRTTLLPGRLLFPTDDQRGAGLRVEPLPAHGSGDQVNFSRSTCLIRREVEAPPAAPGELIPIVLQAAPVL